MYTLILTPAHIRTHTYMGTHIRVRLRLHMRIRSPIHSRIRVCIDAFTRMRMKIRISTTMHIRMFFKKIKNLRLTKGERRAIVSSRKTYAYTYVHS